VRLIVAAGNVSVQAVECGARSGVGKRPRGHFERYRAAALRESGSAIEI
jgi:hypothetical protein